MPAKDKIDQVVRDLDVSRNAQEQIRPATGEVLLPIEVRRTVGVFPKLVEIELAHEGLVVGGAEELGKDRLEPLSGRAWVSVWAWVGQC